MIVNNNKKILLPYQIVTAVLTFLSYAAFHCTRKAFSAAKSPIQTEWNWSHTFLGVMDFLFLSFYAIGLYISGYLGDKFNMKRVLLIGMLLTSIFTFAIGFGKILHFEHHEYIFGIIWSLNGLVQSTGWPTSVGIMGNWFDRNSSGRVFGVWSANASAGNIIGNSLVGLCSKYNWPIFYMFALPSGVVLVTALLCIVFLHNQPQDIGLPSPIETDEETHDKLEAVTSYNEKTKNDQLETVTKYDNQTNCNDNDDNCNTTTSNEREGITIKAALKIPGVISYACSYACIKMVNYSLFFWLPYFLSKGLGYSNSHSDTMSNLYDFGQIFGGAVAGWISDRMGVRSPSVILFIIFAIASLSMFTIAETRLHVELLLVSTGFLLGGPANLISSAISADLGKHESIRGNAKALSTVTGIIDGTGSVGAAVGQLFVSYLSHHYSWHAVFYLLMIMSCLGGICIARLFFNDMKQYCGSGKGYSTIDNVIYDESLPATPFSADQSYQYA